MADRPGNGKDGPDFDWLYGKGRGPGEQHAPPADRPEPTFMLPQQPRPGDAPPPRSAPRQQPPAPQRPAPYQPAGPAAPPTAARRSGSGFWRRPRTWLRIVLLLLVLWLVYLVAVPLIAWNRVTEIAFEPDGERPDDQPGTTYLMVGSDSRAGLSEEERKELATGNAESSLADTIMMMHTGSGPDVLLSFPRDWVVDGAKINSYYDPGDPTDLVAALEQQTGIRIDEYVEIGLGGVAGVVDAIGGIEICPKQAIDDPKAGLDIEKGCQEADGPTALGYSRTRATALGDLDRVGRQREVVAAIGEEVLSPWTFINPVRWWRLNNAVPDFFAFGEGTGPFDAGRWALAMTRVGGEDGLTCTMPVTDGSATVMDESRARPLFDAIIEDRTDDITKAQCTAAGIAQ